MEKIRVVFTIPELQQRSCLTLLFLAIYRVGWQITLPISIKKRWRSLAGGAPEAWADLLNKATIFSASQISQATIFGLGIMPYISASIIFQFLASVYPPLEKLQKEGESGRKKINEYTRYATVLLCLVPKLGLHGGLDSIPVRHQRFLDATAHLPFSWQLTVVLTMTAGTVFLMWLGEQIDEYGIGNGISLLIMAGILARMPARRLRPDRADDQGRRELGWAAQMGPEKICVLMLLFVGVVVGVVLISQGQRRIPTQSAKHVRGRRVFGGNRQYLPLRVNQAGVMPIIFASSLLLFPMFLFSWMAQRPIPLSGLDSGR